MPTIKHDCQFEAIRHYNANILKSILQYTIFIRPLQFGFLNALNYEDLLLSFIH